MLTDTALRNLKSRPKPYKASDRDGMYVTVSTAGTTAFRYDYRLNGRRETLTIGRYGPAGISIAMAREKLLDVKRAVAWGESLAYEKQREKRRLTAAKTFGDMTGRWLFDARMADISNSEERMEMAKRLDKTALNYLTLGCAALSACLENSAAAAPLADLSGGQTGRIEFTSSTPDHRWALIRGRLGPEVTVYGDLLMPTQRTDGKVSAVVFSHGSEGVSGVYFDVWAKALNNAGYAVFVVDSFKPRGEDRVTGPTKQLTWNTVANTTDALNALKLLATHPQIDSSRIFHMGWSRGGQALLDAAWPTYQQHVLPAIVKWAGGVAVYPGCNMRYRVDHHSKLPAPILMILGEKDDMTLPKPCMELADEYAAAGHPVSYKVYAGATHVFDRLNLPWKKYNEGNFNLCSMDVRMPYGANDRSSWGPAHDKISGKSFTDDKEWNAYMPKCKQTSWITVESNDKAREQAVKDVLAFLKGIQ